MIPAIGSRIGWLDLPGHVRAAVEDLLGSPVVAARSQSGGFSPGTADRVVTASGERAFVKAVSTAQNTRATEMARDEARVTAALPADAPTPRMLGSFDDGEWVALVLEDVEGRHPRTPWVPDELEAVTGALRRLARMLTPAPLPDAPRATDHAASGFHGWAAVAADPPADLDPWAAAHSDDLRAAAARGLAAIGTGETLTHLDIRADNILIRPDGGIVVVDWPWGCIGPDWLDTVLLALNVIVYGGDADPVLAGVDPGHAVDVIAGFAGAFTNAGRLPPPPGLPTLRAFQRLQADALLPWLRQRLGPAAHPSGSGNPAH
ncbi:phosphotransferase [Jidongwangia harbinensis]|uniref:phosphotransferase n=1 Tax=Jidongwangia harbinensis TaxID=2878561 RepID=UPI001CD971BC|nr:phosphotransferase [Jidongwangia harbinensis]MCA2216798.1 phosphotransferase [Jidongwangia harbinensis]